MRRILVTVVAPAFVCVAFSIPAQAAPHQKAEGTCTVSADRVPVGQPYVLSANGLPSLSAINLFVTDATGTVGSPLGSTPDGTFAMNEWSAVPGTTTYQFTGPVKNNTQVYATCSVDAYPTDPAP